MPILIIEKGADRGKSLRIDRKYIYTIGRGKKCHITLSDMLASRYHFEIKADPPKYRLRDLGSLNGTFLNGQRCTEADLKVGDIIQVGETLFSFTSDQDVKADIYAGRVIAGFKIIERVGRGGMGVVYKAVQLSLNRPVALKILASHLTSNKTFIEFFIREARMAAMLNHPNIAQIYDAGTAEGLYYLAMEFVGGGSLQDIVSKRGSLPLNEALPMFIDAARGLEYAEKKGLVHRDIKPDNLMLGEDNRVKIVDLGLAAAEEMLRASGKDEPIWGTPQYIAPEQVSGKPVDHRCDIYSLGASFYRILSGTVPFSGSTTKELLQKKVASDATPLCIATPSIPKRISDIIEKMMRRNPDERYQSISEPLKELEEFRRQTEGIASGMPSVGRKTSAVRRKKVFAAIAGVFIIACVGALISIAIPKGEPPPPPQPDIAPLPKPDPGPDEAIKKLREEYAKLRYEALVADERKKLEAAGTKFDPDLVASFITVYQEFANEFGDTSAAILATDRVKHWSAELALYEAKKGLPDKLTDHSPRELEKLLPPLRSVSANYPGTNAAKESARIVARIIEVIGELDTAISALDDAINQADASVRSERFQEAMNKLEDTAIKYPYKIVVDKVREKYDEIDKAAANAWDNLLREVQALTDDLKYEEAIALIEAAKNKWDMPELVSMADREIKKLKDHIAKERTRQLEADRQHDIALLRNAHEKAKKELAVYRFSVAQGYYESVLENLKTIEFSEKVKLRIEDCALAGELMAELVRRINSRNEPISSIPLRGDGRAAAADEREITLEYTLESDTKATVKYSWSQFSPDEIWNMVSQGWKLRIQDRFGLVALLYLTSTTVDVPERRDALRRLALEELDMIKSRDEDVIRKVEAYRKRIAADDDTIFEQEAIDTKEREEQAAVLFKSIIDAQQQGDNASADRLLKNFKERYSDTEFAKNNQHLISNIEATLEKLRAKLAIEVRYQEILERESKSFEKSASKILPKLIKTKVGLEIARLYFATERFERAFSTLHNWITNNPGHATVVNGSAHAWAAKTLALLGRENSALEYIEAARKKATEDRSAFEFVTGVTLWLQEYPASKQECSRLMLAWESNPDNPDALWELCTILRHRMPLRKQERGALVAMRELFPEHAPVKNGDCLWRLAENAFDSLDFVLAKSLYEELAKNYPENAMVKQSEGQLIKSRIKECDDKIRLYGLK